MQVTKIYKDDQGFWQAETRTGLCKAVINYFTMINGSWYNEDGKKVKSYICDILNNSLPARV